jgi:hypothetical protein
MVAGFAMSLFKSKRAAPASQSTAVQPDVALAAAYRAHAAEAGGAPTADLSDEAIGEVHRETLRQFTDEAAARGQTIAPTKLQFIVLQMLQVRQRFGPKTWTEHLHYELEYFREKGALRPYADGELQL